MNNLGIYYIYSCILIFCLFLIQYIFCRTLYSDILCYKLQNVHNNLKKMTVMCLYSFGDFVIVQLSKNTKLLKNCIPEAYHIGPSRVYTLTITKLSELRNIQSTDLVMWHCHNTLFDSRASNWRTAERSRLPTNVAVKD